MSVLARPRHPIVADALELARAWCDGQVIDNAPALSHAVRVAVVLGRHVPAAPPELIAAALLHDAPEFAPPCVDLDALLTARLGPAVTTVVRALEREHQALASHSLPDLAGVHGWTVCASAADKIVSLGSILGRADRTGDPAAYWAARGAFLSRADYFRAFHTAASPHLPGRMGADLGRLVDLAVQASEAYGPR
ncbi:HD domain-containing protein [Rhizomonospora bruguierae]|uniref:HD domain-containing protein n=1 Tax=Rhizomonospora bruguierae TaxID=1581705 RepID=UPI001BCC5A9F|nr:HD domain-containing protein [Micromonospora sp. NBRC 107566]